MSLPFLPAAADPGQETPGGVFLFGHLVAQRDNVGAIGMLPNGVLLRPFQIRVGEGGIVSAGPIVAPNVGVFSIQVSAANVVLTATQSNLIVFMDTSGGNRTVTLPVAADAVIYAIKKISADANTVTITPTGAETIDGAVSFILAAQHAAVPLAGVAGTGWFIPW